MEDYKQIWKSLKGSTTNKSTGKSVEKHMASAAEMLSYCLIKAMTAKSLKTDEERQTLAVILVERAFTPIHNEKKLSNNRNTKHISVYRSAWDARYNNRYVGLLNMTEDEKSKLWDYIEYIKKWAYAEAKKEEFYSYIFVRTDILNPVQMAVQASHAFGCMMHEAHDRVLDPNELNIVLCEAKDGSELDEIKSRFESNGIGTSIFLEPDLEDAITAMASYPVSEYQKKLTKEYKLLAI